ncbi:MAG: M18 family aminopeptidase, partial [Pseudomonadales bacterium]
MASTLVSDLLSFLRLSPTPFHATSNIADRLANHGFTRLRERDHWSLTRPGKYFVTRNDSSIIAFQLGTEDTSECGLRLIGAHTDSPCLKPKPYPNLNQKRYAQWGVEVYGGVLLNPWFDRDLSLAGKVSFS